MRKLRVSFAKMPRTAQIRLGFNRSDPLDLDLTAQRRLRGSARLRNGSGGRQLGCRHARGSAARAGRLGSSATLAGGACAGGGVLRRRSSPAFAETAIRGGFRARIGLGESARHGELDLGFRVGPRQAEQGAQWRRGGAKLRQANPGEAE